jgi:peptidoglycan hydrolase-like protein with peptidoglycan-binding domain
MKRIFTAVLISFSLAVCVPVSAAKKSTVKKAPVKTVATKSKSKSKTKAVAVAKKPTVTRYSQEHPTAERYTEIQQALVDRGYLAQATGIWGDESLTALKKFQADQQLPADGKLGARSLTALGLGPRRGGTVEDAISAGILPSGSAPTPLD